MKSTEVYLSLGSNVGNRESILKAAIGRLEKILTGVQTSAIYETQPLYVNDQPLFLNMVISGYMTLSVSALFKRTQKIEADMGRDRRHELKNGPRRLDIDILLLGKMVIQGDRLTIPHPGIEERFFVLVPLVELNPDLESPVTGVLYSKILKELKNQGVYTYSAGGYNP